MTPSTTPNFTFWRTDLTLTSNEQLRSDRRTRFKVSIIDWSHNIGSHDTIATSFARSSIRFTRPLHSDVAASRQCSVVFDDPSGDVNRSAHVLEIYDRSRNASTNGTPALCLSSASFGTFRSSAYTAMARTSGPESADISPASSRAPSRGLARELDERCVKISRRSRRHSGTAMELSKAAGLSAKFTYINE